MPERIRLSRRRGFDLQAASRALNGLPAKVVARPSRYGNPFRVVKSGDGWVVLDRYGRPRTFSEYAKPAAVKIAIILYRDELAASGVRRKAARDLRGYNLACWCQLDEACHADVLLALASTEPQP